MANDQAIGRHDSKFCGRLVALPSKGDILKVYDRTKPAAYNVLSAALFVEFPAMPDEIAVDRSTEYFTHTNQAMPDGIHQYLKTKPLEIRFSFRLHYADPDYCKEGPLTLLQIASRLHAFVLPINPAGNDVQISAKIGQEYTNSVGKIEQQSSAATEAKSGLTSVIGAQNLRAPVTCQLELMYIGAGKPGIICRGYVREVTVKFLGPWLRGNGNLFNLPSAAEYGFTFIHHPAHSNVYGSQAGKNDPSVSQPQAYAGEVLEKFYFTRDLVRLAVYQGINDAPAANAIQNSELVPGTRKFGPTMTSPTQDGYLITDEGPVSVKQFLPGTSSLGSEGLLTSDAGPVVKR